MATKRIAVLGGPRCGKTTLIQHLYVEMKIAGLNAGYALEYSTEYLKDKGMIETISEQYGIYLGQKKLEDELAVFDYALTDYATFVPYIQNYDMIVYVPREFGYIQDGVRWQDEDIALQIDDAILNFLKAENVNYIEVKGSTKERSRQILDLLGVDYQETIQLNDSEK